MKPNVFLREQGLNGTFKLKGAVFNGTLLDLLQQYDLAKAIPTGQDIKMYIWTKRLVYVKEVTVGAEGWCCNLAICGDRDIQTLFHNETDSNELFPSPCLAEAAALQRAVKWVNDLQNEINKLQN